MLCVVRELFVFIHNIRVCLIWEYGKPQTAENWVCAWKSEDRICKEEGMRCDTQRMCQIVEIEMVLPSLVKSCKG